MAGRAAAAVKSGTKSKPSSKATTRSKAAKSLKDSKPSSPNSSTKAAESNTETPEKPKTRRRTKPETRTRMYWAVFNQSLKRVAVFEFDQKGEAEKRAVKLSDSSGDHHFIQKIKATVQV